MILTSEQSCIVLLLTRLVCSPLIASDAPLSVGSTASDLGNGSWEWTVFLIGPDAVLARVKCVQYLLDPTFPHPSRVVCTKGTSARAFALTDTGWGAFSLSARITFLDRTTATLDFKVDPQKAAAQNVRINPVDGLKYVRIPSGSFMMGCSPDDDVCNKDISLKKREEPHLVKIASVWIGQTEVSQAAWDRVMKNKANPSIPKGTDLPVQRITLAEAVAYCDKVKMALPTEEQWEYAARAGSTSWKYGDLDEIAWYGDNSGRGSIPALDWWNTKPDLLTYKKRLVANGDGPHSVKSRLPNSWGLYDMIGNVAEWIKDNDEKRSAKLPGIVRGGSWDSPSIFVRVSYPQTIRQDARLDSVGFRCAGDLQ